MQYYLVDNRWIRLHNSKNYATIEPIWFRNRRQALRVFLNNFPKRIRKTPFGNPLVSKHGSQIDVRYRHERDKTKTPYCWMYWDNNKCVEQLPHRRNIWNYTM